MALIIGNAAYAAAPLLNPANDARAVSDTLKGLGFAVVDVRDGSKAQMEAAISEAGQLLRGRNGVGLLYYAGHGLQLDWRNYMVPVDARLARASDVAAQTVDLQQVIDAFKAAGNRMNIVVLDACRDNPFAATASGKGLAPMDAPPGTYLAYATAPGNVAEDGTEKSGNGLYTQYLVRELKEPGTKIEDIFKRVRFEVRRQSQGRQVPWESTSLEDDFYFDPKVRPVKLADTVQAREVAEALARESADWHRIKDSKQPDDFYAFLQKYPNGLISEQAQFRLDQLQKARVQAQPGANGVVALASGTNRYAKGDEFVYDVIDGFTKTATRLKRRVTFADIDRVEMDNGQFVLDQMGGLLKDRIGTKEPAELVTPAELAVGKRWRSAFTNTAPNGTTSANYWDAKVVAFEEVVVPAGRFMAFRVERVGEGRPQIGAISHLTSKVWVDPNTMLVVRIDRLFRDGGKISTYDSRQLVSVTRAPRPAGVMKAAVIALALGMASATAQAPNDLRVALVIGNAAYAAAPLLNPANDAKAMSEALRAMGFTVFEARDASKAQMQQALAQAGDALKGKNGVGMLYYAGHGLQLDWRNYMVPVDARLARASDVAEQTVDLQQVIEAFKAAGNRMNIVVLDACRDNPFAATASGKGLAPMDAPPGTYLAYATAPGNVAEDGTEKSGNGLYTQYLVRELKEPGAKIEDVFKRVRFEVRRHSQGRQVPWESTSLEDDFYFDPKVRPVKLADAVHAREVAEALARESAEWHRIKDSKRVDDFYAFLQKYPNGLISEQAQFRLDQLQKAKVQAQPGANGVVALASGTNRYAKGDEFVYDVIDGFSKAATRTRGRVTFADAERVEFGNRGGLLLDQMGGVLRNGVGSKEPADLTTPAELAIGKRWRSAFTNTAPDGTTSANYWDAKVVAFEEVVVPAGRFMAFRIERVGQARPSTGSMSNLTATYWVDPTTMLEVRTDRLHRRDGKITTYDSRQLVSVKRAPRPAGP